MANALLATVTWQFGSAETCQWKGCSIWRRGFPETRSWLERLMPHSELTPTEKRVGVSHAGGLGVYYGQARN